MKTTDAISHYTTTAALAAVLDITSGAISQWGEFVPEWVAGRLEKETKGVLVHDIELYKRLAQVKKEQKQAA
ncbi:MAG: Cro/CI family transcriptional regulator [Agitococcus sp.]|nr:Cro/CI family transcriptional regulator [Agitococcus sp.]